MKNKMLLVIPVGIAAVVLGCQPKNDLGQVKGTVDTLKTEWYATDSILTSLSVTSKSEVTAFQQSYLTISSNESYTAIQDVSVKEDVDSIIVLADIEVKEAEVASAQLDSIVNEWKTETEEFKKLVADVEANKIPADSAEIKVSEFKTYLASTTVKTKQIQDVIEDTKLKNELLASEINKKINPTVN